MSTLVYGMTPPVGVRKAWFPCSVDLKTGGAWLRRAGAGADWGEPANIVHWERPDGTDALIAADYPNGRRIEIWLNKRTTRTVFKRVPGFVAAPVAVSPC